MYTANDAEALVFQMKNDNESKAEMVKRLSKLCLGWPYVWASQGEMCTPSWRRNRIPYCREPKYSDMIRNNCPVLSLETGSCYGCKWDGVRCFDCRGFTRWLLAQAGVPLYGDSVTTQWETASNWVAKGDIDTLPKDLVCCIFRPKHTGMYQGNGNVIHCSGTVKEEALPGTPNWERWGVPAGLYTTDELRKAGINVDDSKNTPTLRRGNTGSLVEKLQKILKETTDAALSVDGIFGAKTEKAVEEFQRQNGLAADGVVGKKTWAKLNQYSVENEASEQEVPINTEPMYDNDDLNRKIEDLKKNVINELEKLKSNIAEIEKQINSLFNLV